MSKVNARRMTEERDELLDKTVNGLIELMADDTCGTIIIGGDAPIIITIARGNSALPYAEFCNAHGLIDGEKLRQMATEKRGKA